MKRVAIVCIIGFLAQAASAAWVKQRASTFSWLYDVTFVGESKGFIVGAGGTLLESADGGSTWEKRRKITDDAIRQIIFSDAMSGWLLCERDIYSRGARSSSYLLKTTDGGDTWHRVEFEDGTRERITRIFFNPKGIGFAVGEKGVIHDFQPDRGTWKRQPSAIKYLLLSGTFADDRNATLVGAGGSVYFSDDAGSSWLNATISGDPDGKLNSVFFLNRNAGWIAGANGTILQTQSGGRTWRAQNTGVSSDLTDVRFLNSGEGFAVGSDGAILHTTTAGNVWVAEKSGVRHRLERIAVNGKRVFAVGFGGTILTNNGGTPPRLQRP